MQLVLGVVSLVHGRDTADGVGGGLESNLGGAVRREGGVIEMFERAGACDDGWRDCW